MIGYLDNVNSEQYSYLCMSPIRFLQLFMADLVSVSVFASHGGFNPELHYCYFCIQIIVLNMLMISYLDLKLGHNWVVVKYVGWTYMAASVVIS